MNRHSSANHHHQNAASHHERAAHHHRKAAKHRSAGNTEKASHHAQAARGHALFASESANQASKQHAMDESGFMRAGPAGRDEEGRFTEEGHTKMGRSGYGHGEDDFNDTWSSGGDEDEDEEDNNSPSRSMRGSESDEDEDEESRMAQNGRSYRSTAGGRHGAIKQSKGRQQRGGARSHAA